MIEGVSVNPLLNSFRPLIIRDWNVSTAAALGLICYGLYFILQVRYRRL